MPRTTDALRWTKRVHATCDTWHPLSLTLNGARRFVATAEQKAGAHDGRRRASASVQWADTVVQDSWRGARFVLTRGLAAAAIPLATLPSGRASYWACAVPVALFGTGTTDWARGTGLDRSSIGRAAVGLVGYGLLGAALGFTRGTRAANDGPDGPRAPLSDAEPAGAAPANDGAQRRRSGWMATLDAVLVGVVVLLHAAQGVACLYPTLFVAAAVVGAGLVGLCAGALVGALRGPFVEHRRPAAPAAGAAPHAPPPVPPRAGASTSPGPVDGASGIGWDDTLGTVDTNVAADTHRPLDTGAADDLGRAPAGSGLERGRTPADRAVGASHARPAATGRSIRSSSLPAPVVGRAATGASEAPPTDNVLANGASAARRVGAASPEQPFVEADVEAAGSVAESDGSSEGTEASEALADFYDAQERLPSLDDLTAPSARVESDSEDGVAPRRVA